MSSDSQAERYKSQGNTALQAGLFSEAIDLYTKAIGLDPNCAVYFSNRSAAYANVERFREALDDAQEAVSLEPQWVKGHVRRGNALTGLKKHEEARKAYLKASQIEPGNDQLKAMVKAAAEAAQNEGEKDWEQDLWSEEEKEDQKGDPEEADAGEATGVHAEAHSEAGDVSAGTKKSAERGPEMSAGAPAKRRKASARVSHLLDRAVADASEPTLRATLTQLGRHDHLLAEKIIQILDGMSAASSADEASADDGGDSDA
eukprot:3072757-Pleurochrysis_carterae.AAC.1